VGDVADGADVEGGLATDDLRGVGGESGDVLVVLRSELLVFVYLLVDLFLGEADDVLHDMLLD
jgi:hypothetical protein